MSAPVLTRSGRSDLPSLADALFKVRRKTSELASCLIDEDQAIQANADASPTKWHLAHTSWFFETFVLQPFAPGYRIFDERFNFCFNSYYEAQGARQPRTARGLLSRPAAEEVRSYRTYVDDHLLTLLADSPGDAELARLIELGVNHEEQHQELLLTDILSLFAANPLRPAYREGGALGAVRTVTPARYVEFCGGVHAAGHDGRGFAFDNESPRHETLLRPFRLADRLVVNAEWFDFMADGGYKTASLWLADGWAKVTQEGWRAPLYFEEREGRWLQMTLWGLQSVDLAAPVAHVSYYEADAFARWAGKRLPTEFEWEAAAAGALVAGNMLEGDALHPLPAGEAPGLRQLYGDVWEWTASAYSPYPGYRPQMGPLGEYNGKFMCGQQVLRGSSCVTPTRHARPTYRNFFYPHQRWQFSGLRLADDV